MFNLTTKTQKVSLKLSPREACKSFVNSTKHNGFTGSETAGRAKVNSKFISWDGNIFDKFLKLERYKRSVQEWQTIDYPKGCPPSQLEFVFGEVTGGSEVAII